MDAANRWETEAIRESRDRRTGRPAVSQDRAPTLPRGDWRTLREASELTGIPIGTLRKWCRRETVSSYLEADGELTLRMVEMASVRGRAAELHRSDAPGEDIRRQTSDARAGDADRRQRPNTGRSIEPTSNDEGTAGRRVPPANHTAERARSAPETPVSETMIVPVDAWNKMLNQLGNLHEAGQQLAEARERAAKAETEATFLRERLAEMRGASGHQTPDAAPEEATAQRTPDSVPAEGNTDQDEPVVAQTAETTSFWRYVARGWKGRRR